jgi:hypothetical protein
MARSNTYPVIVVWSPRPSKVARRFRFLRRRRTASQPSVARPYQFRRHLGTASSLPAVRPFRFRLRLHTAPSLLAAPPFQYHRRPGKWRSSPGFFVIRNSPGAGELRIIIASKKDLISVTLLAPRRNRTARRLWFQGRIPRPGASPPDLSDPCLAFQYQLPRPCHNWFIYRAVKTC